MNLSFKMNVDLQINGFYSKIKITSNELEFVYKPVWREIERKYKIIEI